jgi:hypothetical protein
MKNVLKWLFTHEPAIVAGIIAGLSVFFSLRYGTKAGGALQGTTGGLVAALFGVLRNFVTSPATKAAVDAGQANLPAIASDVAGLKDALGTVISHPGGIVAFVEGHIGSLQKEIADLFSREKSIAQPIVTVGSPSSNQPQAGQDGTLKPVLEPSFNPPAVPAEATTPAPADPLAELAKLVP